MASSYNFSKLQNGSDIRGVAIEGYHGEEVNLTPEISYHLARAFSVWLSKRSNKPSHKLFISIGVDSRLSGPSLKRAFIDGLLACGVRVIDCGLCTTPAMFMTTVLPGFCYDGAVMITASHLPYNRNGFKFFTPQGGLEHDDISNLLSFCQPGSPPLTPVGGTLAEVDFLSVYAGYLRDKIRFALSDDKNNEKPLSSFKICVDAGNGAGGFFVTQVLNPLGADTRGSQFLEPDGRFPNHIPNPENPQAMEAITSATLHNGCDLGIIFDTDVDRCAVVDANGKEINRNRLIGLMSAIVLEECPTSAIVTDSVTSQELKTFINQTLGGVHHRFKRGYKNVINEGIRLNAEGTDCLLAIETSGHGALRENYFLDDGAYMVAKMLVKMAKLKRKGETLSTLLSSLKDPKESMEFRLSINTEDFKGYGEAVLESLLVFAKEQDWNIAPDNHEGLRISFPPEKGGGWFLLRMSLHDPLMPLNIESSLDGGVVQIARQLLPVLEGSSHLNLLGLQEWLAKQV